MLSWARNNRLISRLLIVKLILTFAVVTFFPVEVDAGRVYVRGYYRKDGTYVKPHYRSAPDGNPYNNYSFPGNYNPNTRRITPGNPQTYLNRYYNRSSTSSAAFDFDKWLKDLEKQTKTGSKVNVRGYFRSDGTYVKPHTRTAPDGNPYNNYSFPGNYNPNTRRITPGNPQTSNKVNVRGYFRSNGTYVKPHTRTAPDGNPYNNYSYPGNYNPNTGKVTSGNFFSRLFRFRSQKSLSSTRQNRSGSSFTVGSTKSEVIAVQGMPDKSSSKYFVYGASTILFKDGRVTNWFSSPGNPLKVVKAKSTPMPIRSNLKVPQTGKTYFTVGSTKSEVIAVQGVPDKATVPYFDYGASTVLFKDGRVTNWFSSPRNPLKAKR